MIFHFCSSSSLSVVNEISDASSVSIHAGIEYDGDIFRSHISFGILLMNSVISASSSGVDFRLFLFRLSMASSHKKKSKGLRSGERGAQMYYVFSENRRLLNLW